MSKVIIDNLLEKSEKTFFYSKNVREDKLNEEELVNVRHEKFWNVIQEQLLVKNNSFKLLNKLHMNQVSKRCIENIFKEFPKITNRNVLDLVDDFMHNMSTRSREENKRIILSIKKKCSFYWSS
jgi:hypothetical protein